ncbi:ribosomal protein S18-alanine N-acetyltransferase [Pseudodesulfovibrio portus]|uniref:[Ribosomal protein bS18]-alanine N-acetyltransferase n=1 Tax=Pseudodesulfovibrio portus TaxID=231439 RepID=A0ABM8AMN5_9BACT|nr:ribosomal protein S18-alanine N-acetyltransferase [Pseudodesulfovibrio portus]BDQ32652.1 ribosomal-protein-alanine acetyltransferase [Pseudodesulfovibrio portus]
MESEVTPLGAEHVRDLMALEGKCFAYHWTQEQFLLGLERSAFQVLGIYRKGILAGYIAFSIIEDEMEILNLAVHPDFRRQGLGEKLLKESFRVCNENNVRKSFLDVKVSNEPALGLYRKFGYKKIGVRKKYYPDTREDALLFRYDFT